MDKRERLESQLAEIVETTSAEEFIQWMNQPFTKWMFLSLQLDDLITTDTWKNGVDYEDSLKLQGKAAYIDELIASIREAKKETESNE